MLESFGPPHGKNNPYFLQLVDSLPPSIDLRYFSWRHALVGRYDVFHVHWPEVVLRGRTRARSAARLVLFVLVLVRIRLQRRALVRTLHNAAPHEPVTRVQARVIRFADRCTTLWITLSDRTVPPTAAPSVVVPHGHYRDWFDLSQEVRPVRGRVVFCGRVRRYKGVERLLQAFAELPDQGASLHIVGRTEDAEMAADVRRACLADQRVVALDDFVTDAVLADEVRQAEVVVLPFVEMTNSGSMLLALSLDRPVLVPRLPVTEAIAAEVGAGWVLLFDGELDAEALARAMGSPTPEETARPDLSAREWPPIAAAHAAAFARAVALARGG
ncbi:MAG: glycosyltransferase [Acidimicrobiales bacterium]